MRSLLRVITRLRPWHAFVFAGLSFVGGQLLHRSWPFGNFLVYQLLFIPAVVIAFAEIKRFVGSITEFRSIIASHPNREAGDYVQALLYSHWALPGLLVVGGLFVYATIALGYVGFDPTGIYALIMIALVMVSAVVGQTCYVYYVLLLRRIAASDDLNYNFYLPARTDWVQLLAGIGTRLSNAFFVLGVIYTTVFYLNVPDGYVELSISPPRLAFATPNDTVFLLSWVGVFALVIIAFPIYASLRSRYMNAIVRKLKDVSIEEIRFLMTESGVRQRGDVDAEMTYYQLMREIDRSAASPVERFNIVPIAATLSSIAVHVIKISESF